MAEKKRKYPPKKKQSDIIPATLKVEWSEYQKDVFRDIAKGQGNTLVIARAGSGKTATLVQGSKYIPKRKSSLFCAFNKHIQEELKQKLGSYIFCSTLHSLGFKAIKLRFGDVELNNRKCWDIVKSFIGDSKEDYNLIDQITRCVSFCKASLVDTPNGIEDIIYEYEVDLCDIPMKQFIQYVSMALRMCKEQTEVIDFDDMIWFPFVYRLNVGKYDYVMVDECFPYNQCIATENGKDKIGILVKKFRNNNTLPRVLSYNESENKFEFSKITNAWSRGKKQLVEIKCGKRLVRCTENHRFLTNKGWIEAGTLKPGMLIKTSSPQNEGQFNIGYVIVTKVIYTDRYEETYDIEVEKNHNFIACLSQTSKSSAGLIAHNCQDLNKAQIELALSACKIGGRIIAVLDNFQAIYKFRGADESVLENLKTRLVPKELPLPICYRCPKKVVLAAQEFVPDIQPFDKAPEGEITNLSIHDLRKTAQIGDYIISRYNAPLIKHCLNFLKHGVPANILGRDIGFNLLYLIKKSKKKTVRDFLKWLTKWEKQEKEKLLDKYPNASTESISDKVECLTNLCEDTSTLDEVKKNIDKLFKDNEEKNIVLFSSIHRIKGKETNRVFVLADTLNASSQEELNLHYVAITRAKKHLYMVYKKMPVIDYGNDKVDALWKYIQEN